MKNDNNLHKFGARLAQAMHYAGVRKNTVLAHQAGVAEGTIRNWLDREFPPSGKTSTLAKIAEFLGVSSSWLEHEIGPMVLGVSETPIAYRAVSELTTVKRVILRAIESDLISMSDEQAEDWFANYQKHRIRPN